MTCLCVSDWSRKKPLVSHAFASVHCCLVVTCLERADLLALVEDVYCICVTFPCGTLPRVRCGTCTVVPNTTYTMEFCVF